MKNFLLGVLIGGILVATYFSLKSDKAVSGVTTKGETVKIGFIGPLSGDNVTSGQAVKAGVDFAKKELNVPVEIVYEDTKCLGKEAANAINKLISVDKVVAVIGDVCSSATLAAAPIAEKNKVILISAASTSPKLSTAGEYIFRTIPSDELQGKFGAELVAEKGHTKLAILHGNEDYGVGFANVIKEAFEKDGQTIVADEAFERGATDVRAQLTKIKAAEPEAIYLISNSPVASVAMLKQIKELEITAAVFGAEGFKKPTIVEGAGEAAEGLTVSAVNGGNESFIERYKKEYGKEAEAFTAQGYDAMYAVAEALKKGSTTEERRDALAAVTFDGASGKVVFDENGDVSGNYDVYVVKDGAFVKE